MCGQSLALIRTEGEGNVVCILPPSLGLCLSVCICIRTQLETFYHEWGHALQSVLSRTYYQHLSGTRGGEDYVEVREGGRGPHYSGVYSTHIFFILMVEIIHADTVCTLYVLSVRGRWPPTYSSISRSSLQCSHSGPRIVSRGSVSPLGWWRKLWQRSECFQRLRCRTSCCIVQSIK